MSAEIIEFPGPSKEPSPWDGATEIEKELYQFAMRVEKPADLALAFAESAKTCLDEGEFEEAKNHVLMTVILVARLCDSVGRSP